MSIEPSLTQPVRTLQIIVAGLLGGLMTMFVVFSVALPPNQDGDPVISYAMLILGASTLVAGLLVPRTIARSHVMRLGEIDTENPGQLVGIYTTKTIIAGALFEGGAIANLIGFHLTSNMLNLACAIVGIFFLAALFPTETRVRNWLNQLARWQNETGMLRDLKRDGQ